MSEFDARRFRRFNTPVELLGGPPIGMSRSRLYPVYPEQTREMLGPPAAGHQPWMNRSVMHGRDPGAALNAQEAINLARARFAQARKLPVTVKQAEAILRYSLPQTPAEPTPGMRARVVPFIPRDYIPPEAIALRAHLQNPTLVPGVRVQGDDIEAKIRGATTAVMRRIRGG